MENLLEDVLQVELSETFASAAEYIKNQGPLLNLSEDNLLFFYGRFKRIKDGKCETPKPGFFDLQGKRKWKAWMDCNELSAKEACIQYIEKVSDIDPEWDSGNKTDKGTWAAVSIMSKEFEEELAEEDKSIFDWLKENRIDKISSLLEYNPGLAHALDDAGLHPIHWAADRGLKDAVDIILRFEPDAIESKDPDGQTPLHYATSCGHGDVIRLLMDRGANANATDNDGCTPINAAINSDIAQLLKS